MQKFLTGQLFPDGGSISILKELKCLTFQLKQINGSFVQYFAFQSVTANFPCHEFSSSYCSLNGPVQHEFSISSTSITQKLLK